MSTILSLNPIPLRCTSPMMEERPTRQRPSTAALQPIAVHRQAQDASGQMEYQGPSCRTQHMRNIIELRRQQNQQNQQTPGPMRAQSACAATRRLPPHTRQQQQQQQQDGSTTTTTIKRKKSVLSALTAGFNNECVRWRTLRRSQMNVDYCNHSVSCFYKDKRVSTCRIDTGGAPFVKHWEDDLASQRVPGKLRTPPAHQIRVAQEQQEQQPQKVYHNVYEGKKQAVAFDYAGRRIVIDPAHWPVLYDPVRTYGFDRTYYPKPHKPFW